MQDFPPVETQLSDTQLSSLFPSDFPSILDFPSIPLEHLTEKVDLRKEEPDIGDLDDLDKLLTDSLAIAKKSQNKRIYKELKKAVDEKILCDFQLERWEVLEDISVWVQTRCKCGELGGKTFLRNMQKMKKVGSSMLHWKEVKELTGETEVRYALITIEVNGCGCCQEIGGRMFVDF
jgi:hypothetical protein